MSLDWSLADLFQYLGVKAHWLWQQFFSELENMQTIVSCSEFTFIFMVHCFCSLSNCFWAKINVQHLFSTKEVGDLMKPTVILTSLGWAVRMTTLFPFRFLPQVRETRKEFMRIGEDLDLAAVKNGQTPRHKTSDAERASHLLLATRKCYQHFALDYCLQVPTTYTQLPPTPTTAHKYIKMILILYTLRFKSLGGVTFFFWFNI